MKLYHYTSKESYEQILAMRELKPSVNSTTDASYGPGWYFTNLGPESCEMNIKIKCWGSNIPQKKIEYYFCFDVPDDGYIPCRENVYLIPLGPQPQWKLESHGKKMECPRKPCEKCPNYTTENKQRGIEMNTLFGAIVGAGVVALGLLIVALLESKK